MATRRFHIANVLNVIAGIRVSHQEDGREEFLKFMVGNDNLGLEIDRRKIALECRPWLLRQFPGLAPIALNAKSNNWVCDRRWLAQQASEYGLGEMLEVEPLPGNIQRNFRIRPVVGFQDGDRFRIHAA